MTSHDGSHLTGRTDLPGLTRVPSSPPLLLSSSCQAPDPAPPQSADQPSHTPRFPANFSCQSRTGPAWSGSPLRARVFYKLIWYFYSGAKIFRAQTIISGSTTSPSVINRKYELQSMRFVELRNFIGEFFPFLLIIQATPPSMIKDIFLEIKQNLGIKPIKYNQPGLLSLLSQRWKMKDYNENCSHLSSQGHS